jgi:LmbE family N-acetylglucosaminyl deacetylase
MRRRALGILALSAVCGSLLGASPAPAHPPSLIATRTSARAQVSAAQIMHDMRSFRVIGAVLHVGAHPDDENTQLIAYLARGRAYRTAYLSVTRGDGGQNLLGPELGEKLGVARTQELLAARRIDGGRQFFTRAIDYGFSKDVNEALGVWGHKEVLGDVVRVIRTFRPDVIITRFSTEPGGTHGHHTASAVLALEAFRIAGDPGAYPEQLGAGGLEPWQPKRIFVNGGTQGRGGAAAEAAASVRMDISGVDPVLNESFASVAARSRGMHKTQGFGQNPQTGGPATAPGAPAFPGTANIQSFQLLDGAPATTDIMQDIDTTWNRVPGGAPIAALANELLASFNPADPAASVKSLLQIRRALLAIAPGPLRAEKLVLLDRIIQECLGLTVETVTASSQYVPGDPVTLRSVATITSHYPVQWTGITYSTGTRMGWASGDLTAGNPESREFTTTLPVTAPVTQPYWLRAVPLPGLYVVNDPSLIGTPENAPALALQHSFDVDGERIFVPDEPLSADTRHRVDVIAPASFHFLPETELFVPGTPRTVTIGINAARAGTTGTLRLDAPAGWRVAPASVPFRLTGTHDSARVRFTVTPPAQAASATFRATATINGVKYDNERIAIDYPHIPLQLLQPAARLTASSFSFARRGHTVGYMPGAGDFTADALRQMGYDVVVLDEDQVTPERLKNLDAVVLGIRVMNVRNDLASAMPALFAYVQNGGTVIEQYSQTSGMKTTNIAPFPLTLSSADRITDENSAVTFLEPAHPVLNSPNRITAADFRGWVQERGSYYAREWDPHFTPIVAGNDPGEAPLKGGLLVAKYGKGWFVYTGLSFFRQLPAGVPGAYKLFANLIAIGRNGPVVIE